MHFWMEIYKKPNPNDNIASSKYDMFMIKERNWQNNIKNIHLHNFYHALLYYAEWIPVISYDSNDNIHK